MKTFKYFLIFISIAIYKEIEAQTITYSEPVQLATGMSFTEGPSWHPDGYLVFSDINANKIYKWSETGGLSVLNASSGNSNGIVCTKSSNFYVCRHTNHDIAQMDESGNLTSVVSTYNGKRLNSPNDLELSYLGTVYFTDPDYGVAAADRQLTFQGLFCILQKTNKAILLDSTLVKPNGLTFGNDARTLFVNESSTNNIYSYTLRNDTILQDITKDKKLFAHLSGTGEVDGLTADVYGNLFVAFGDGGIIILSKDAVEIGTISFPAGEKVRNLSFGGKYKNILFVTAGTSIYKIEIRYFGYLIAPGLLGVPTNNSVIFNALSDKATDAYIIYGTSSDNLYQQTAVQSFAKEVPIEIKLEGLNSNTKYYYQLKYRVQGETSYTSATSGSFYTQRANGQQFSFAVEADPHLDEGSNYVTYRNMLQNAANLQPDFLIDLGDNFMTEKWPLPNQYYIEQRHLLYRNFWDKTCASAPLFIVQGNHDTELRWLSQNSATDPFNLATADRKKYYPTPKPDGFYTGNSDNDPFVDKRENYYAWTWGDALFVVIDPYGYTETKPVNPWGFTLGKTQYDWFRATLENSSAKFKFVFAHQLVGGDNLGRGGSEKAAYFENGGNNADGTYGFDTQRPGWGKPLHQIMKENGVQIYFHGHDHVYAEQPNDGIVYQECPQPSFPVYNDISVATKYGYVEGTIISSSGHLNVTILGDSAKVDYIAAYHIENSKTNQMNGNILRTYYVRANNLTSIQNNSFNKNIFDVYQSSNTLFVKAEETTSAEIYLYSITGSMIGVLHKGQIPSGTSTFQIPENLANGIYIVSVKGNDGNIVKKIIK